MNWKLLCAPGSSGGFGAKIVGLRIKSEGGRGRRPEGNNGSSSESGMKFAIVNAEHVQVTGVPWHKRGVEINVIL